MEQTVSGKLLNMNNEVIQEVNEKKMLGVGCSPKDVLVNHMNRST